MQHPRRPNTPKKIKKYCVHTVAISFMVRMHN
uniref:Uncharacterized protein n=1 Tax=Anguilla anguilla TaxID=7936 RepID=A0A0E9Q2H9_ANGAN